jgi:hypothetical protein
LGPESPRPVIGDSNRDPERLPNLDRLFGESSGEENRDSFSIPVLAECLSADPETNPVNVQDFHRTAEEQAFVSHFNSATFNHRLGPAISWLNATGLHGNLLAGFQRGMVEKEGLAFMEKIEHEDLLPKFVIPWSSPETFISRVRESLEVDPDLRPLIRPALKAGISA